MNFILQELVYRRLIGESLYQVYIIQKWLCFREIDMQALIGNVGGYIGLCLGYTILQIPEYLQAVFHRYKERNWPY